MVNDLIDMEDYEYELAEAYDIGFAEGRQEATKKYKKDISQLLAEMKNLKDQVEDLKSKLK